MTDPIPYSTVSVESTFPISRRPIYIHPIADVTNKNKDTAWPLLAKGVVEVCNRNADSRILVHTVSYQLTEYLLSRLSVYPNLSSRVLTYKTSLERQRTLDLYQANPASILLAPSLSHGIDLPNDLCRVIIICKVPFPNLGDKQISARLHSKGGNLWYRVQAVRSIVQMSGRGMRHEDDYCETYILDSQFVSNLWRQSKALFPGWWVEALKWHEGKLI